MAWSAAELAKLSGRPVHLMLDRAEEHVCTGNRPNSVQHLRLGADKKGRLSAISVDALGEMADSSKLPISGGVVDVNMSGPFGANDNNLVIRFGFKGTKALIAGRDISLDGQTIPVTLTGPLDKLKPEDTSEKLAIIFGNEVFGVEDKVMQMADLYVEIPQSGTKHSRRT